MPTIYYFESPEWTGSFYLGGYLHTEVHIISNWFVPGTLNLDRKSTRLNSSHVKRSRMPSSA